MTVTITDRDIAENGRLMADNKDLKIFEDYSEFGHLKLQKAEFISKKCPDAIISLWYFTLPVQVKGRKQKYCQNTKYVKCHDSAYVIDKTALKRGVQEKLEELGYAGDLRQVRFTNENQPKYLLYCVPLKRELSVWCQNQYIDKDILKKMFNN